MVKVVINEFKVVKLNLGKKFVEVSFGFEQEGTPNRVIKSFTIGENITGFVLSTLGDIRKAIGMPLVQIDKEEEMKEKLVNTLNRLLMEIADLTKIKESEKYMKQYSRINSYKVAFPEFNK